MAQVEPATPGGGGPNRLFVIIALGLVGLLILGVIAAGAILVIPQMFKTAAVSPTAVVKITTPTRTLPTATATATATDTPAATATSVIQALPTVIVAGGGTTVATVASTASITETVGPGTGTPTGTLPKSGMGENLLLLAGGAVLVLVIVAARRARSTGAA